MREHLSVNLQIGLEDHENPGLVPAISYSCRWTRPQEASRVRDARFHDPCDAVGDDHARLVARIRFLDDRGPLSMASRDFSLYNASLLMHAVVMERVLKT